MSAAAEVLKKLRKDMGDEIGQQGVEIKEVGRIPTGIFPLDLALGGGFPRGRVSIVYGNEGSCKTALTYLLMAQVQREGKKAVYLDIESSLDSSWAAKFGINMKELIVITPAFAEQAVDVVEAMLYADDVGIVVIDSIAAMTTDNEIASSAEKMNVGGNSYVVGKMIRKAVSAMSREAHNNHYPALVCINQIRMKIGVMFGNPETFPGGNSLRFASSLTVRLNGKDDIVKEVHADIPTFKIITGSVQKAKMPILSKAFEYSLTLIPHGNMKVGQAPTWTFIATYCRNAGLLTQAGAGKPWTLLGKTGNAQKDIKLIYETDIAYSTLVHQSIIAYENNKGVIGEVEEAIDPDTGEITQVAAVAVA